jgi:hypothetical protein
MATMDAAFVNKNLFFIRSIVGLAMVAVPRAMMVPFRTRFSGVRDDV